MGGLTLAGTVGMLGLHSGPVATEPPAAMLTSPKDYDYALQGLKDIAYNKWREYDPEDTLRFYALRLHEASMLKSRPQRLIAQGTDWRFLQELKKELKGYTL